MASVLPILQVPDTRAETILKLREARGLAAGWQGNFAAEWSEVVGAREAMEKQNKKAKVLIETATA